MSLTILYTSEAIFLVDIILNFFKAYKVNEDEDYQRNLKKICINYLKKGFILDILVFLPLGQIGQIFDEVSILKFLDLFKLN